MIWSILDVVSVMLAVVAAVAALWSPARRWTAPVVMAAATVSLVVSAGHIVGDGRRGPVLLPAVTLVLVGLFFVVHWRAPSGHIPATLLLAMALAGVVLGQAGPDDQLRDSLAGIVVWWFVGAAAAGLARYLVLLDRRRERLVAEARRSQRLALARDLHDFVAHDVSAIVVQAQVGQFAGGGDPQVAVHALRRIEEAGTRALGAMDRAIHMLHAIDTPGDAPGHRRYDLADLPELTERFADDGPASVHLTLAPDVLDDLPPDVSTTGYRVVVEALTNVRRHAPNATQVEVSVERVATGDGSALRARVWNDGTHVRVRSGRRSGIGLLGLRERVEAIGGALDAGPDDDGWHVTALLPLPDGIAPDRREDA